MSAATASAATASAAIASAANKTCIFKMKMAVESKKHWKLTSSGN